MNNIDVILLDISITYSTEHMYIAKLLSVIAWPGGHGCLSSVSCILYLSLWYLHYWSITVTIVCYKSIKVSCLCNLDITESSIVENTSLFILSLRMVRNINEWMKISNSNDSNKCSLQLSLVQVAILLWNQYIFIFEKNYKFYYYNWMFSHPYIFSSSINKVCSVTYLLVVKHSLSDWIFIIK